MNNKEYIYFVGVGGIGMSALARYFNQKGKQVAGYDRTITELTKRLQSEGVSVNYVAEVDAVAFPFRDKANTLVVYTPAISKQNPILSYFLDNGFECLKRAEVLGLISKSMYTIAVAGTHGKTTVSSMVAFLLHEGGVKINAFLGGISRDFGTNLILGEEAKIMVTEADEYDRSFLQLNPNSLVITSIDADHLDIYRNHDDLQNTYRQLVGQLADGGVLLSKPSVYSTLELTEQEKFQSYSTTEKAAIQAKNIRVENGAFVFDYVSNAVEINNISCGLPGLHNVENAVAAITIGLQQNIGPEKLKESIAKFQGVKRRFDVHLKSDKLVYIDDYAHHPEEIKVLIASIRELYPKRKLTAVFQPHLYSRTRDFGAEFALALDGADEVILLDIYAAREEPIEGIDSHWLVSKMEKSNVHVCSRNQLINLLKSKDIELLVTAGAGDIDTLVEPIVTYYESQEP